VEGDIQRTFGRNLKAWREARGISQEALAETLGHNRTYIGGFERGERNPSLKVIERLAAQMDVEPFKLLMPRSDDRVGAPGR
jgi:transcriptional regulator with XRE-family HTH domain